MRLADYSSDEHCFEFDPHTGVYSHLKLPSPRKDRAGYSGMGQLLLEKQRADFVEMWSSDSRS